jgi:hypothetical protein
LFIDPKVQPEYLPPNEVEKVQDNALKAGRYMTAFFIFFPLIVTSFSHFLWSFLFLPFFFLMLIFSLVFETVDYHHWIGIIHIVFLVIHTIVVAASFYTNEYSLLIHVLV